jgi:hypothetical protein
MTEKKRKQRVVREPPAVYEASPAEEEAAMRKNYRLRQSKIDRAMRVLGTGTETETIERALELVVFRGELVEGVRAMRGAALEDPFGGDA